jgi:NAD(P)-dependent dehydrogenase (short-subunit alcohol dehydrogenase family)
MPEQQAPQVPVALVTGSSSGFGLLTCVELARRGMRVFASMRDLGRAERLDQALAAAGVSARKLALDVTDAGAVARAVADVEAAAGRVDVLVNNAGYGLTGFVEDLDLDEVRAQLETNFFGALAVLKAVLPGMRSRGWGRIINVSSVNGRSGYPGFGAYCASKFALEGLAESLRHEVAPHGVYVVLIEPGPFPTDIFDRNRAVGRRALAPGPNHDAIKRLEALVDDAVARSTADPAAVARVIGRAAAARRPRLRYVVGADARLGLALQRLLPARLWEAAIGRALR